MLWLRKHTLICFWFAETSLRWTDHQTWWTACSSVRATDNRRCSRMFIKSVSDTYCQLEYYVLSKCREFKRKDRDASTKLSLMSTENQQWPLDPWLDFTEVQTKPANVTTLSEIKVITRTRKSSLACAHRKAIFSSIFLRFHLEPFQRVLPKTKYKGLYRESSVKDDVVTAPPTIVFEGCI